MFWCCFKLLSSSLFLSRSVFPSSAANWRSVSTNIILTVYAAKDVSHLLLIEWPESMKQDRPWADEVIHSVDWETSCCYGIPSLATSNQFTSPQPVSFTSILMLFYLFLGFWSALPMNFSDQQFVCIHFPIWFSFHSHLNLFDLNNTRSRWVVRVTPRSLYPCGNSPRYPLNKRLGELVWTRWLREKNSCPSRESNPGCPTSSLVTVPNQAQYMP